MITACCAGEKVRYLQKNNVERKPEEIFGLCHKNAYEKSKKKIFA